VFCVVLIQIRLIAITAYAVHFAALFCKQSLMLEILKHDKI